MNAAGESPLHEAYIGLGSNIAPQEYLPRAVRLLGIYVRVAAVSPAWETPPVGMEGDKFLNAAAVVYTQYSALQLKHLVLRRIEAVLGRVRTQDKFAPRTIDLDILIFDKQVMDPEIWHYPHLAAPLAALAGGIRHPQGGQTLQEVAASLLAASPDIRLRPEIFPYP